jgi:hypothetical protein
VDTQLGDTIAYRLNLSHQAAFEAFDPGNDDTA